MKASVCMLAFNTSAYIGRAIESVLAQKTNFDFELIIAENNSTDNTRQIAEEYKLKYPDKIKLILNPENIGMAANFVKAYKNCSAPYIATLDSDDYWCDPYKLQRQVDFLDNYSEYGVVYSDCKIINEAGDEIEWNHMNYCREQFSSGNLFFKLLKETAFIYNLTTCFRKELIQYELDNSDLWLFEDWWLWMRIAIKSKFYYMDSVTACYRVHPANATSTGVRNDLPAKFYKKKYYAIYYSNIIYFDGFNRQKLLPAEKSILLRKILMLLYRPQGGVIEKMKLIPLIFKYYPGADTFATLFMKKIRQLRLIAIQFHFCIDLEPYYPVVSA